MSNSNGFILLHRKIIDTSFYNKPRAVLLAIHLLLMACHKDTIITFGWQEVILRRGQYVGGYKRLSTELNWRRTQVRRSIKVLEEAGFLRRYITNAYCIITVLNYNSYQGVQKYTSDLPGVYETDTQGGPKQHSGGDAGAPGGGTTVPHTTIRTKEQIDIYIEQFDSIWSMYPRKLGRKEAFRHYKASVKKPEDLDALKTALTNYKNSREVADGYIKHGSTWFNQWQDWVDNPEPGEDPAITKMKESLK